MTNFLEKPVAVDEQVYEEVDDLAGISDDERVAFMNNFHKSCERLFEELGVSEIIAKL